MRLNYLSVLFFFATVVAVALLLFPTRMDMVILYRNSYLYDTALELLDQLERQTPDDRRIYLERARIFYLIGRYEQAIEILEGLATADPDDPEIWRVLAQNYLALQQHPRAARAYERLLASAPADREALAWLDTYYRLNQLGDRRVENLENLIAHSPDDFYGYEKLVDLYMSMGRPDDALRTIERTAIAFPDSVYAQEQLGQFYLSQRDPRALPVFQALHQKLPDEEGYLDGLLNALIVAGQKDEALARFQQFYRPRLREADYYQRLGQLYLYLSDTGQARQTLEQQLAIAPSVDTRLQLLQLYADAGQYDQAIAQARLLVQETPDWPEFWRIYVDYLAAAEYKEELIEALEYYTARWPEDLEMWVELADAYEWIENSAAALPIALRLFQQDSSNPAYRERLARLYLALGDHPRAAAHYAWLLRLQPDSATGRQGLLAAVEALPPDADALAYARQLYQATGTEAAAAGLLLGQLYQAQGQADQAEPIYAALHHAYPDSAGVQLRIGQQLLDAGRLEAARACFLRVLDLSPDQPAALSGLAAVAYEQDPPAALPYLQRLENLTPDDPATLYRLGLVYEAMGDSARMVGYYQRMLALTRGAPQEDLYFLRQQAHALLRTGSPGPARQLLDQARRQYPETLELVNDYAEVLIAQREYDRALEVLDKVPGL